MTSCQVCGEGLGHGRCFVCRDYRATAVAASEAGVRLWSGTEARALRTARRMSIRDFAEHLGVSDRIVSKWEAAGEKIHPRPVNQAALDTSLARCDPAMRARFLRFIQDQATSTPDALGGIEFTRRESAWH